MVGQCIHLVERRIVGHQHRHAPARQGSRARRCGQSLRGTIDDLPHKALPPVRKFQQKPTPNLTGTMAAFRPDGALGSGKIRPASTGDYEPWIPE